MVEETAGRKCGLVLTWTRWRRSGRSGGEGQEQVWPLGKSWRAWHFWPHHAISWWKSWEECTGEENPIHCNDTFLLESEERQCLLSCLLEVRGWCWMQCLHDQVVEGGVTSEVSFLLWQVFLLAGKGGMAWEGRVQELREGSTKKPGEGRIPGEGR